MAITPDTNLKLLKCNLNLDEMNQLNFGSTTAQYNFFNSLQQDSKSGATYQRKDNVIRYPAHIDSIMEYNYVMYQNHNYTNKWFYAYIVRMEYVNDNMTNIYIKTDPYQTWQFDIEFKRSFVEREHVNNDTFGLHTVPENLETGEYIINEVEELDIRSGNYFICMGASEVPSDLPHVSDDRKFNGIYSGLYYILFDTASDCSKMIRAYDKAGKAEAIYSIFIIPTSLSFANEWYTATIGTITDIRFSVVLSSNDPVLMVHDKTVTMNTTLNGYTPKNNKLKCYPFNYLYITNNSGSDITYNYEEFDGTPTFNIDGAITPGCSIKLYPKNYKKYSHDVWIRSEYNYGINGGKYPICPWNSDSYTNWLTQNGVNQAVSIAFSGASLLAGVGTTLAAPFTGGASALAGAGMITAGLKGISDVLVQDHQHSLVPDQANGNTNAGDVTASAKMIGFYAYKMSIKQEYAKIIDDFFSTFGYKVNTVKIPNITGRRNWNYVKTIDVNIEGYIPQEDLNEIKGMFNNGVTIWHNPATFLDYSQNNDII